MSHARRFVAAGAVLVLAALLLDPERLSQSSFRGSWFYSPARLADLRLALLVAGICAALFPWVVSRLRAPAALAPGTARLTRPVDCVFALALAASAISVLVRDDPVTKDTKFYLGESLDIAAHGGPPALVGRCFDGTWAEDNRHPFYLAAIAPFAEESQRFTDAARGVALAGALTTLFLVLRACRRRGGEATAALGGVLLVTNAGFVEQSVTVSCECWWTAFAVLAFDHATREKATGAAPERIAADAERRGDSAGAAGGSTALGAARRWSAVGAALGFAFLTKGTGTLLALATLAWIAWTERARAWRALAWCAGAFGLVALPLLVRNGLRFGNPLWNVNSAKVFWLDNWQEFFDPAAMAQAGPVHYFATHSALDVASRLGSGLVKQAVHALEACAPGAPRAAWGVPLLLFLCACVARSRDARMRSFLVVVAAAWLASFAWYARASSGHQYLGVLLPLLLPASVELVRRLDARRAAAVRAASVAVALVVLVASLLRGALEYRPAPAAAVPWNQELRAFLRESTRSDPDAIYLLGPSRELGFDWDRSLLATRLARPEDARGFERVLEQSRGERVRFLVVEARAEAARFGDEWAIRAPDGTLAPGAAAPGWSHVASFPAHAPRMLVFARQ